MFIYEIHVALPSDVLEALGEKTGHFPGCPAMEESICDAIRAWIKASPAEQQQQQQQAEATSEAGYQWKQVFLPEGTRLRASFGRQPYFAVVEGAQIKYEGQSLSPSSFANLRGSGHRNAWKAIWLRLPGSDAWLLADVCRSARTSAITRMVEGDAHAAGPAPRTSPGAPQDQHQWRPPRRTRGTGMQKPAAVMQSIAPPAAPQHEVHPSGAPGAGYSADDHRKRGAGHGRRRKQGAKKHARGKR